MSSNLLVMVIDLQGKDIMLLRDLREESFLTFSGFCCWFVFYYLVIYIYIYIYIYNLTYFSKTCSLLKDQSPAWIRNMCSVMALTTL